MGPEEFFSRLIQTLPTFWAERILILRVLISWFFLGPKFLAWAQFGPKLAKVGAKLGQVGTKLGQVGAKLG